MKHASDVLRISEMQDEECLATPQMRGAAQSPCVETAAVSEPNYVARPYRPGSGTALLQRGARRAPPGQTLPEG